MKPKSTLLTALAAVALFVVLAAPRSSHGQAGAGDDALTAGLLAEVSAQQNVIADNQAKIDDKVAALAEELRLARIYIGRAGGKAGGK